MAKHHLFVYLAVWFGLSHLANLRCYAKDENQEVYIVYMGATPPGEYSALSHHQSLLQEVLDTRFTTNYLVRSYHKSFNGFAAKLTKHEAQKLASKSQIVSVFPSKTHRLQITRSWDFMGFNEKIVRNLTSGSDVIVGVIDTGIWPENEIFNDKGFGPPPKKWKGACRGGKNFTCNNKIIGARYYTTTNTTRDYVGHGSHCSSIAAGNIVNDVSFYGVAQGIARGGLPTARIASYSTCSNDDCEDHDILAAFDDAIADGVDIITISIGNVVPTAFHKDTIAIGAFHAMEKGILTVQSAGNVFINADSVTSVAPWKFAVAASTTDRHIIDKVVLGNKSILFGNSINSFSMNSTKFPLVYGNLSADKCSKELASVCGYCMDPKIVKGSILLCGGEDDVGYKQALKENALGAIFKDKMKDNAQISPLPVATLNYDDYVVVESYTKTSKNPKAEILKSEGVKDASAPKVASFSCHGPNKIAPEIMKPDISAPGVNVLAAFSPTVSPSGVEGDNRHAKYSILSGTSMSCPHVAGVAAYVKAVHPDWSPSAIKSAIMTTAWPMNATQNEYAEFAFGSGHVNPVKSIDPGLIYEINKEDYVNMLCGMGYAQEKLRSIFGVNSTCPKHPSKDSQRNLNYPSMTALSKSNPFNVSFTRTVTNFGTTNSTYEANVVVQKYANVTVTVTPRIPVFKSVNEKKSFTVTVTGVYPFDSYDEGFIRASLVFSDGNHHVRSPIIVYQKDKH